MKEQSQISQNLKSLKIILIHSLKKLFSWVAKTKNGDTNYQRGIDLIHFVKTICGRIDIYVPEHKCYILQIHSDCHKLLKMIQ
jgi:hypothetical protein